MIIIDALQWWYGPGWLWFAHKFFVEKNQQLARFFSFKDLAGTLFSPFRQDASSTQNAPLNIKLQAMGMNLVSRFFGFFIRIALLLVGLIAMVLSSIYGLLASIAWPLIPLSPILGIIFFALSVGAS